MEGCRNILPTLPTFLPLPVEEGTVLCVMVLAFLQSLSTRASQEEGDLLIMGQGLVPESALPCTVTVLFFLSLCREPTWTGRCSERTWLSLSTCVWADVRPWLALRSPHQVFGVEETSRGLSRTSQPRTPCPGSAQGPSFSVGCSQTPEGRKREMN